MSREINRSPSSLALSHNFLRFRAEYFKVLQTGVAALRQPLLAFHRPCSAWGWYQCFLFLDLGHSCQPEHGLIRRPAGIFKLRGHPQHHPATPLRVHVFCGVRHGQELIVEYLTCRVYARDRSWVTDRYTQSLDWQHVGLTIVIAITTNTTLQ
jgi:hypothetical protein